MDEFTMKTVTTRSKKFPGMEISRTRTNNNNGAGINIKVGDEAITIHEGSFLLGSQQGSAEEIAEELMKQLQRVLLDPCLLPGEE